MDLADKHLFSWTDWYFGGHLNDNWSISDTAAEFFSRTYAKSIAGRPQEMHFNVTSKEFKLCYSLAEEGTVTNSPETEIYASFDRVYPKGLRINTTPNVELAQVLNATNTIIVRNKDRGSAATGSLACVHISPV